MSNNNTIRLVSKQILVFLLLLHNFTLRTLTVDKMKKKKITDF